MHFASDNWAGASERVMSAIAAANEGMAPAYGADALTRAVTERFCEIFGRQVEVHFVATGTAANALSIAALAKRGGLVFAHADAHVVTSEAGAVDTASGMRVVGIPGPNGKLSADRLASALAHYPEGETRNGVPAVVSLTQASEVGTVYRAEEIGDLAAVAHSRGLGVHMDGARFASALAFLGASPAALTWGAGVDVMSFGCTKGGALGAEAIVVFDSERVADLPILRLRTGHVQSKARFIAAQFMALLGDEHWLELARHANAMAMRLANGLSSVGVRLAWPVESNAVFPVLPRAVLAPLRAAGATFYEWPADGLEPELGAGETVVRLVTSFRTPAEEADRFVELTGKTLAAPGK